MPDDVLSASVPAVTPVQVPAGSLPPLDPCPRCDGSGTVVKDGGPPMTCALCGGAGKVECLVPPAPAEPASAEREETVLVARYPHEMRQCQAEMARWAERRVRVHAEELADLQENYEIAVRNQWGASALRRQIGRTRKLVEFYGKVKAALEAGYCLVPNFPTDVFAVRTRRKLPAPDEARWPRDLSDVATETLPAGEGRWVDNDPMFRWEQRQETRPDGRIETWRVAVACNLSETIDFPFILARPEILEATERAMVVKVFDDLGVLPARPKKDPLVVGRIKVPNRPNYSQQYLTFLVAWFVDLRDLEA